MFLFQVTERYFTYVTKVYLRYISHDCKTAQHDVTKSFVVKQKLK